MQSRLHKFLATSMVALLAFSFATPAFALSGINLDEDCKVDCVDPHSCCDEAKKVIDTLQLLVKAYTHGDLKTYEEYLDDNCSTFSENTKKLVSGKQNVLAALKRTFDEHQPGGPEPLLSFTIDQPYAKVTGDTAVVTFVAYRSIGGAHPTKEVSHVTDIFVKHEGKWKKLHYRGKWQKSKDATTHA